MMTRLGKILFYLCLGFITIMLAIQIPKVNTRITEVVLNAVLPQGMKAELSQIRGEFPFDVVIDTIKVFDREGEWLAINRLEFSWAAANAFFGKIDINRLGAEKVEIIRFPEIISDKPSKKSSFFFPVIVEEYFINYVKISPWYSGSLKIHGDASLAQKDQANFSLFIETIDQTEHGDADLLELKVHTNGNKLSIFAEAKDSLSRFKTISPELASKIKEGDYELYIDLEANLDGTNMMGVCTGAINNFASIDARLDKFIGNQLDWHIDANLDESNKNIIGEGEFSTSNHIKANWNLNYHVISKVYKSTLKIKLPHVEQLMQDTRDIFGDVVISADFEGDINNAHQVKWVLTGPFVFSNEIRNFSGNVFYENQKGRFDGKFIQPGLETFLHGDFYFKDDLLFFNDLLLKGTGHKISGNLSIDQGKLQPHEMNLQVAVNDVKPLATLFGHEAGGGVTGTIRKKNDLYDIDLKADNPTFKDFSFQSMTSKISFKNFENFLMDMKIEAGYYKRESIDSFTLTARATNGNGKFEGQFLAPEIQAESSGSFGISGQNWNVLVKELQFLHDREPVIGLATPLHLEATPESIKIAANKVKLSSGELRFTNLEFGKNLAGKLTLVDVTPKVFRFLSDELEFSGKIGAELEFSNPHGQRQISGNLFLTDVTLVDSSRKMQKLAFLTAHVTYQNQKWSLKVNYHDTASSRLEAQATVFTTTIIPDKTAKILANAKGTIDLSICNTFIWWGDRLKGELKVDLNLEKNLNQLQQQGTFTLNEGAYENAEFGTILRHIDLKAHLRGSKLQITKLSGTDFREGNFAGSGVIQLADLSAIQPQISLKFDKMLLANDDIISLNASGNIEIKPANKGTFVIGGEIQTNFVRVFLEDTVQKIKNINTVEITEQSSIRKKKPKNRNKVPVASKYDLKVRIPGKLLIEGRGIKSLWKGDLHIKGALNTPEIQGCLEVIRGRVDMIGKQMVMNPQSKICFVNLNGDVEPLLNIKIERVIREVEVIISVQGTAAAPKIDFISMPPMSQEEIVSLLLFGKPLNSVSSAQSLQLATKLAAIKAGHKGGNIIDKFQEAFGLDELSVGSNESLDDNEQQGLTSGYSVRVGKQLNDKVYFGVNQSLGAAADTKAVVDIDITKETQLNLEAGSKGGTVGYSWERRY